MALVSDIVARFKVETSDYVSKLDAAKSKNKEIAQSLLDTAGSADKAIASLQVAKGKGALGDFGIDPRSVSGVITQIKQLDKEARTAAESAHKLGDELREGAKEARGYDHIVDSLGSIGRGDFLGSLARFRRGLAEIKENGGGLAGIGNSALGVGLALTAIGVVGDSLNRLTSKAVELKHEFQDGSKSAGDIAEELLKSVPVLGSIWSAGRNIRELIGLDNDDLQRAVDLQNQLNAVRSRMIDILKQSNEEVAKFNEQTEDIVNHTAVVNLQVQGKDNEAKSREIADKLVKDVKDSAETAAKSAQGKIDAITATLNTPTKDGGQTVNQQLAAAQLAAQKAKDAVNEAQNQYNADKGAAPVYLGEGGSYDPESESLAALNEAKQASAAADERLSQIQTTVNQRTKERTEIETKLTDEIKKRTAALIDASAADVAKQFAPTDPRAVNAQAGADRLKADVAAILGGLQPVEDKVKAVDDLIRDKLGHDAAKALAGLVVPDLDANAKAAKFLEQFKAALAGKQPIAEWLNQQLGGDAIGALSPTARIIEGLTAQTPPDLKVRITPEGDIKTWITNQHGDVTATVLPKGESLEAYLKSQNIQLPANLVPKGQSLEDFVKEQTAKLDSIKPPELKFDVSKDGQELYAWFTDPKTGNKKIECVLQGDNLQQMVKDKIGNFDLPIRPDGKSVDEWLRSQKGAHDLVVPLTVTPSSVDLKVQPKLPNLTDLLTDSLKGNPVTDWLERQTNKVLKGKSLSEWITKEIEEGQKRLEKLKEDAQKFKEDAKTPAEKLSDQLKQAQDLYSRGLISKDDLSKFDNKDYRSLMDEKKQLESESDRYVYELPEVKNLRAGTALFAPPTQQDDKRLAKLQEILDQLKVLTDNAAQNGIDLTVNQQN